MKAGVFKLNMHPKEYFNGNPYRDDGKGAKHRRDQADRSKSAPSDRKVFKYSSPGKSVCSLFFYYPVTKKIDLFSFSLVVIKMDALINFPNETIKILLLLVPYTVKLKMK